MSEFTDDLDYYEPPPIGFEDLTWKTKEGEEILICHLEDDHLMNIYKMLKRKEEVIPYMIEMEIVHRKLQEMVE